ncbi:MAG: hypothetical protein HY921_03230 [Elusimicrobia bacterium]|nr:hypothetical protein [Elusimicrobiota bacterium]
MEKSWPNLSCLLAAGLALTACAGPRQHVYRFASLGFSVRVMPHRSITAADCGSRRKDDGSPLAHADGWKTASADQLHWR